MKKQGIDQSVLYKVLPEYDPISAHDEKPGNRRFKSIDTTTGDIYLITHPNYWAASVDAEGRAWRHRPAPELVMTYDEAKRIAEGSTARDVNSSKGRKNIF